MRGLAALIGMIVAACGHRDFARYDDGGTMNVDGDGGSNAGAIYIKASNTDTGDRFGNTLALSGDGNTLAVGAIFESSAATGIDGNQGDNLASRSGAVYVFVRTTSGWTQQAYLKASNTEAADHFGAVVALSADGNTLAVSSREEDSATTGIGGDRMNNAAMDSGAVFVFVRAGTTWTQEAYVKASNTGTMDEFGHAIALSASGDTMAVGATSEDSNATGVGGNQADNSLVDAGAVYIFQRTGLAWTQQAYIKASNPRSNAIFGSEVALSGDGNTLAASASFESSAATGIDGNQQDATAALAGAVYTYQRSGTTWSLGNYIKASNTNAGDVFGASLVLSSDGTTLAAGGYGEASNATGINGNQADNSASSSGAGYVFTRGGASWQQQAYVKASNTEGSDGFGSSAAISLDGNVLVIGAGGEDSAATGLDGDQANNDMLLSGAAYLFVRSGGTWSQLSYLKAPNPGTNDRFGHQVAISNDARTIAVSAEQEASAATGVGGDQSDNAAPDSGAVYVFQR